MSYTINGQVYTDNPMMDQICYNCKLILKGIVVKNEFVANNYETEETLTNAEYYTKCIIGTMTFDTFPFTTDILMNACGYSYDIATRIERNRYEIPEEYRAEVLEACVEYYIENFVEKNKYYRSLMGLPEYGTDEYNIYITESDLPPEYDMDTVDFTLPLHEQPSVLVAALRSNGRLEQIIEEYRSFNYSYLNFIGDKRLNLYDCRRASKWDILYIPEANEAVINRFKEFYAVNREIYLKRTYQEAYAFNSEYYDHILIVMVLLETFNNMITDVPEWYIRKDIFDIRSVQYFLEAYGVEYFAEIPLKFQIRIVKNLNKLLMYKSTDTNFQDIIEIFNMRNTYVYKYFLYKKRRLDSTGKYIESDDLNRMYELQFIEVVMGDSYDNYIKDLSYRVPYDEVTLSDEYWDGVDDHDTVKQLILQKEFTVEPTKYLGIKTDVDYIRYQNQLKYFLSLILDSRTKIDDLKINVPSISEDESFTLTNLFLFVILANNYHDYLSAVNDCKWMTPEEKEKALKFKIIRPADMMEEKTEHHDDFVPSNKPEEWWLKERYSEFFYKEDDRMFGFNLDITEEELVELLNRPYKNYKLKKYNMSDFGCDEFIYLSQDITTIDRLLEIYETNLKCYENLNNILAYKCDTKDKSLLGNYLFESLFTKKFDYGMYQYEGDESKDNLEYTLKSRDFALWMFYRNIVSNPDEDGVKKDIETILNEIINILEYYFNRESLDYLFSFISVSSFNAILHYIYLMLNVFKSYKSHFIEPVTKYLFERPDIGAGNYMEMHDTFFRRKCGFIKYDKLFINDAITTTIKHHFDDYLNRLNFVEILDIFTLFSPDPDDDNDYDGGTAETQESAYIKDIYGGTAENNIPFIMVNGHAANGSGIDRWDIDGRYITDNQLLQLNGGYPANGLPWDELTSESHTYSNRTDADTAHHDNIVNFNFFTRLYDMQTSIEMLVASRTGFEYIEEDGVITLKELWRDWRTVNEFEELHDLYYPIIPDPEPPVEDYHDNFIDEDEPMPQEGIPDEDIGDITDFWNFGDLDEGDREEVYDKDYGDIEVEPDNQEEQEEDMEVVMHNLYHLDNLYNNGPDIGITAEYIYGNEDCGEDWDLGDEDENPRTDEVDYDFGDEDINWPGNMGDGDYNFGELLETNIIFISALGNKDTSRIITLTYQ